jgi:prepilin-type N-terminal cleavage/methylation domain-containing protein
MDMHRAALSYSRPTQRVTPLATVRTGFTAIEVLFALSIVTVALFSLHGLSARTLRRITDAHRETIAGELAQLRIERLASAFCASTAGRDSADAVTVDWQASVNGGTLNIVQAVRYPIASGIHSDSITAAVPCH